MALRKNMAPPRAVLDYDTSLTPQEREDGHSAGVMIGLHMQQTKGHILRDRKNFLRFARTIMGDDGVLVDDATAQRFWSRARLDDELCHDADLDVTDVFSVHAVGDEEPTWVHTHGLAEAGAFDFDILEPSPDLAGVGHDALRALAFAILEGGLQPNTERHPFGGLTKRIRMVAIDRFNREADELLRALRSADEDHNKRRSVVCEPIARFWLPSRRRKGIQPSRFLSKPMGDNTVFPFSVAATELMAERARGTWSVFRSLFEEFAELELPCIVKLGYATDGGGPDDREHLWFTVHQAGIDTVDATLVSKPLFIAAMKRGQRGVHSVDHLTDWTILVPGGMITPRDMTAVRCVRDNIDAWREVMADYHKVMQRG